jgi:acyl carrier protein phosphodiesterase
LNYLAHILLSGPDKRIAVGNFIGDGVKGRITDSYPKEIFIGLHLHRFIDHVADTHPANQASRESMYPVFGKYAGVAQDMLHDHFLAGRWDEFSHEPIEGYLESFYATADEYIEIFPPHQKRFFEGIRAGDWLINYRTLDGMERAFSGLSKRVKRENPLAIGGQYLIDNRQSLEASFLSFFPLLVKECESELERLLNNT